MNVKCCFVQPKLDNIPDGDWYCYECISKVQLACIVSVCLYSFQLLQIYYVSGSENTTRTAPVTIEMVYVVC